MSTNARIGVLRSESEVESIYVHWDGYPSNTGAKLRDHWTNPGRVNELIALGDLSSLGSILGSKHDFDTHLFVRDEEGNSVEAEPAKAGWCLFYGRDRGEQDVGSKLHQATSWPDYGQEWEYLFDPKDRSWLCREVTFRDGKKEWQPLTEAVEADEAATAAYYAKQA